MRKRIKIRFLHLSARISKKSWSQSETYPQVPKPTSGRGRRKSFISYFSPPTLRISVSICLESPGLISLCFLLQLSPGTEKPKSPLTSSTLIFLWLHILQYYAGFLDSYLFVFFLSHRSCLQSVCCCLLIVLGFCVIWVQSLNLFSSLFLYFYSLPWWSNSVMHTLVTL